MLSTNQLSLFVNHLFYVNGYILPRYKYDLDSVSHHYIFHQEEINIDGLQILRSKILFINFIKLLGFFITGNQLSHRWRVSSDQ